MGQAFRPMDRPSSSDLTAPDPAAIDLAPVTMECLRCHTPALMRFYGMCVPCRDELRAKYSVERRTIDVPEYTPKMNVTPNAVAVKDD